MKYSTASGPASRIIERGSPPGVAIAPKAVRPTIIPRHQRSMRAPLRTPVMFSSISSSGSSKASPKTITMRVIRSRKSSSGSRFFTFSGVKPSMISAVCGRIAYAR